MAGDAKALQLDALSSYAGMVQPLAFAAGILRDLSAHGHARNHVEMRQHAIQDVPADVVEIDAAALRCGRDECRADLTRLVEAGIKAQVGNEVLAFPRTAGDADDAAVHDSRDLAHGAADGAGRCRHDRGLTRSEARTIKAPHQRGCGRLPHYAEAERERFQVLRQLAQPAAVEHRTFAPAE